MEPLCIVISYVLSLYKLTSDKLLKIMLQINHRYILSNSVNNFHIFTIVQYLCRLKNKAQSDITP